MKRKVELKRYEFPAKLTFRTTVIVSAPSEEKAREMVNAGDWEDGYPGELVDWDITGRGREDT